jgi:hypothetical protein
MQVRALSVRCAFDVSQQDPDGRGARLQCCTDVVAAAWHGGA